MPLSNTNTVVQCIHSIVDWAGAPKEELSASWVGSLCIANGILHGLVNYQYYLDKIKWPTPSGAPKVASLNVMNLKYKGMLYVLLALHISSGLVSHLGSSLSIAFREVQPRISSYLAVLSSAAEVFVHGPTALCLTPIVYGDKGVTVFYYGLVSSLLCLSGASAFIESVQRHHALDNSINSSNSSNSNNSSSRKSTHPARAELRRMNATISVFLYVRLFPLIRGIHGILRPNKYALATLVAGTTMLPVAWDRKLFPLSFYALGLYNWKTFFQTTKSIRKIGIDATAVLQDTFRRV